MIKNANENNKKEPVENANKDSSDGYSSTAFLVGGIITSIVGGLAATGVAIYNCRYPKDLRTQAYSQLLQLASNHLIKEYFDKFLKSCPSLPAGEEKCIISYFHQHLPTINFNYNNTTCDFIGSFKQVESKNIKITTSDQIQFEISKIAYLQNLNEFFLNIFSGFKSEIQNNSLVVKRDSKNKADPWDDSAELSEFYKKCGI